MNNVLLAISLIINLVCIILVIDTRKKLTNVSGYGKVSSLNKKSFWKKCRENFERIMYGDIYDDFWDDDFDLSDEYDGDILNSTDKNSHVGYGVKPTKNITVESDEMAELEKIIGNSLRKERVKLDTHKIDIENTFRTAQEFVEYLSGYRFDVYNTLTKQVQRVKYLDKCGTDNNPNVIITFEDGTIRVFAPYVYAGIGD